MYKAHVPKSKCNIHVPKSIYNVQCILYIDLFII